MYSDIVGSDVYIISNENVQAVRAYCVEFEIRMFLTEDKKCNFCDW